MNEAVAKRPSFSAMISSDKYQKVINNALQDPKRSQRFVASITSAVAVNPELQNCDASTVLSGALLGESLGLSPSPQLGQYYLVPFNNTKKGCKDAQFILGYKGYIQLALRSGYYKKLNVISIKEGELISYDPLNEEIDVNLIQDELEREKAKTTGYYAMFEYLNGYSKKIYWSRQKMEAHAEKYSKGYAAKKGYTFWEKDFDAMAYKTMLRQLISKWGVMSIELQTAYEQDSVGQMSDDDYITVEDVPAATSTELTEKTTEEAQNNRQDQAPCDTGAKQVSMSEL